MEAGHLGRHGDNAAQPAGQVLSFASDLVTTPHPDTAGECAWGQAGMKGDNNSNVVKKIGSNPSKLPLDSI